MYRLTKGNQLSVGFPLADCLMIFILKTYLDKHGSIELDKNNFQKYLKSQATYHYKEWGKSKLHEIEEEVSNYPEYNELKKLINTYNEGGNYGER